MPKLSDTMTDGVLVKWLKQEGDSVQTGDMLAEVETDKSNLEIEAYDVNPFADTVTVDDSRCEAALISFCG